MALASSTAWSQLGYNTNVLPLGDSEALLANTGTGGLGSSGAVFYNPAALTQIHGTSLSLSGSAYMQNTFKADPLATIGATELDYSGTGYRSVPTSLVFARKRGAWNVAASLMIPMQFSYEGQNTWNVSENGNELRLKLLQNYSESQFMGGLTAARRVGDQWSFGMTLVGQYYSYYSYNDLIISNTVDPARVTISTTRDKRSPMGLLAMVGAHWKTEKLGLGLRVATPSVRLWGSGDLYEYRYFSIGGGSTPLVTETDIQNVKADHRTPLDLRLGAVYQVTSLSMIALDASYGLGESYAPLVDDRITLTEELQASYRLSLGLLHRSSDLITFMAGAAYAPARISSSDVPSDLDFVTLTGGLRLSKGSALISFGLFHSFGKGDLPQTASDTRGVQEYTYTGLFIATSTGLGK